MIHTLGYPNPASVFGGGFIYSMGEKTAAVGLILGLDWKYGDLTPQREFERYRAHPFIAEAPGGLGDDRHRRQDDPRGRLLRPRAR